MAVPEFTTQELESEEWRDVVGHEGIYSVSNLGRIRRDLQLAGCRAGRILKPTPDSVGYPRACLSKNGKHFPFKIHHLVMEAFTGPRPKGETVNHLDGNKENNRHSNLEYCSFGDNSRHAARLGLLAKHQGEKNGQAKLTADQVRAIRAAPTIAEARRLTVAFGLNEHNAYQIRARRRWKHI